MILTVKVDAGMEYAQEVKEILAMRVEPLGVCRVLRIDDDGYGVQDSFLRGQLRGIASPVCAPVRNDEDQMEAGRGPGSGFASSGPAGHLPRGEGSAAAQGTTPQSAALTAPLTHGSLPAAAGKERIAPQGHFLRAPQPVCATPRNDEKARGQERETQEIPGLGGPYDETLRYCYELMDRRRREAAGIG